ncbi:MAG: ATP-binding protein, partial [Nitrospinota bacterium]
MRRDVRVKKRKKARVSGVSDEHLRRKKLRTRWSIFGILFLLVTLTGIEYFFQKSGVETPIANNIAVLILVNVNIILLLILSLLVGRNLVRLYIERKTNVIGAKFQTKLVFSYIFISISPSVLLFLVASGLLTNSVNKWFNVQVEKSLRQSLEVAQSFYKGSEEKILLHTNILSELFSGRRMLGEENRSYLDNTVKKKASEYGVDSIVVYGKNGKVIAGTADSFLKEFYQKEELSKMVKKAFRKKEGSRIFAFNRQNLVLAVSPVIDFWTKEVVGVTLASKLISREMVSKINNIRKAFENYMQLKVLKFPIKVSYEITLLLITLVILFAAIWYALYLARSISVPIQELVEATHVVAAGNLDHIIKVRANDEIKMLVDAFNIMVSDLKKGEQAIYKVNEELREKNIELGRHGRYVETILENVAAGVVSIDRTGRVSTINRSAAEILELEPENVKRVPYRKVFDSEYLDPIRGIIRDMRERSKEHLQRQLQVMVSGRLKILMVNLNVLKGESIPYQGLVVVFDDLTELIKAQKIAAWQEVAQGIAHEIKNPLTPIQLSTERLQKKFRDGASDFGPVFNQATEVIIKEVDGLRKLVDEFSKFARMPEPNPKPENIYDIIEEVVNLYKDNRKGVRLTKLYERSDLHLNLDRGQIKRVFINIVENALDAVDEERGVITLEIIHDRYKGLVYLIVSDNGCGVLNKYRDKLFLPYFSTKKKGTGLGLAIANRIIVDHNGGIKVEDNVP